MTNENNVAGVEEVKESKKRRAPLKSQKTGAEIVAEIEAIKAEVEKFEEALQDVDTDSVAYPIVHAAFEAKQNELTDALNKVHFS